MNEAIKRSSFEFVFNQLTINLGFDLKLRYQDPHSSLDGAKRLQKVFKKNSRSQARL